MNGTRKIILTYGLIYLATALAINGSMVLSNALAILSIAILLPRLRHDAIPAAALVSFALQALLYLAGSRSYLTVTFPLLTVCGLSVIYNSLLTAVTVDLGPRRQLRVLSAQALMFVALSVLTMIADLIIHRLTGLGVLDAFWFLLVQLGAPIALAAIGCLYRHASRDTMKSQLSQ